MREKNKRLSHPHCPRLPHPPLGPGSSLQEVPYSLAVFLLRRCQVEGQACCHQIQTEITNT